MRAAPLALFCAASFVAFGCSAGGDGAQRAKLATGPADLIVLDARVTTQDPERPDAEAFAVRDGLFIAVGERAEVMKLRGAESRVIDAGGRRVVPGLVDSHLHAVRGGRFYNLELRWDGVDSLARGLALIREQAERTPPGEWVRVVGGWSPHQFRERRMPTVAELDAASPDVPVLVLYLYSQAFLNRAGARALGISSASVPPPGGRYEHVDGGVILHADPNPAILYGTIAQLPQLSLSDQINSTQHFFRELNRFGLTSVVDPGGGGHVHPTDYEATRALAAEPGLPLRISNYLFAQQKGSELAEYERWIATEQLELERAIERLDRYVIEGAGENLVWSAGDFENFLAPRPELGAHMEAELSAVVRVLARAGWPIRIHTTYDESISRVLGVFEEVFPATSYEARWCLDHAETISPRNLARVRALGGGIAIQDRMAFAGEQFMSRYGAAAAQHAPPLRRMLDAGIPLGAGTDGTRVSSYNPWVALAWLISGRTVGGNLLAAPENRLTRAEALHLYTLGSAWFSGEEERKGSIAPGRYADFAILSADYFNVDETQIAAIESLLTVTGGDVVHAAAPFEAHAPTPLPPVSPRWSPVARFGGYTRSGR
jgi:predicted amidohydrolase YtcJ